MLPSSQTLWWVVTGLLVALGALVGYRYGADTVSRSSAEMIQTLSETRQRDIEDLREALANDLDAARLQRDTARQALQELQKRLDREQAAHHEAQTELDLYRRVASDTTRTGLYIDTYRWHPDGRSPWLGVTLVQARGRDRVRGTLEANLIRERQGQIERMPLTAPDNSDRFAFDLRFFETLRLPAPEAQAFAPDRVEILVRPADTRHREFVDEVAWRDIPNT